MEKRDVQGMYKLPTDVSYCKKCTISNQRPRITFDGEGVCSACNFADYKRDKVDWDERDRELRALCDRFRKDDGSYDVIVPCSGGKDGSFVAHKLKYEYGMNPLCVTWAPLKATALGRINLDNFIASGFDHILGTPNPKVTRKLTQLAFKYMGDPFQPFIYGQTNYPIKMAVQHDVSLIMYGENGEVEYGGDMKNALIPTREIADHEGHYFSGKPPSFWKSHGVSDADLAPFEPPAIEKIRANNTEIHHFSYYKYWDPQECYYYARENTGFKPNTERSEGTYSKYASLDDQIDGFHYYLAYIKFGIGRTTSDTAHEIRDGKIERDEGIALIKKYDSELPHKYFDVFLEYCDITEEEFWMVIDSWRSDHIWECTDGEWALKKPIDF
ncbi:N-acetyl sugar amidotransferase [Gammaproteobacteria bacterium]|nr:N-acetyl sugar amidotransferase [Gammaproteobacteria bacterium]